MDTYIRALEILEWTTAHLSEKMLEDDQTQEVLNALLRIANGAPPPDFLKETVIVIASLLAKEQVQKRVAIGGLIYQLVEVTGNFWSKIIEPDPEGDVSILQELTTLLEHIAVTDEFVDICKNNLHHAQMITDAIMRMFLASHNKHLVVCGCLIIGNAASSKSTAECLAFYKYTTGYLPEVLLRYLDVREEPHVIFAAAGCMRHLITDDVGELPLSLETGWQVILTCCQLLQQPDPSVRGEAAAIVRLLCLRRLKGLVTQTVSTPSSDGQRTTYLEFLIEQGLAPSAPIPSLSRKHAPFEIGRMVVAISRNLDTEPYATCKDEILKTRNFIKPLSMLLQQSILPELRSEALMGFALLSVKGGIQVVVDELRDDKFRVLDALKEAGTAKPAPNPDSDNYMMLLLKLIENKVCSLATSQCSYSLP